MNKFILLFLLSSSVWGQTLPYKAFWYRPAHAGFWRELADTSIPAGASISPQQAAVESIDSNFYGIATVIHANAVVVRLYDEDTGWVQIFDGGFSYNPKHRRTLSPVGMEIISALAAKWNLRVIWQIDVSDYHVLQDDAFGSDPAGPGTWAFIQQFFDPRLFYGTECSTWLPAAGLINSCTRSYYNDPRTAGWLLNQNIDATNPAVASWSVKYWNFFYSLVHWGGSTTGFAGIYTIGSPSDVPNGTCGDAARLSPIRTWYDAFKAILQGTPSPDIFGIGWYGNGNDGTGANYNLACASADLATLVGWMKNDVYLVAGNKIMLMEGGTSNYADPLASQFYANSVNAAATQGTAGIAMFLSDGLYNKGACVSGNSGQVANVSPAPMSDYQVVTQNPFAPAGCMTSLSYPSANFNGFHLYNTWNPGTPDGGCVLAGAGWEYCKAGFPWGAQYGFNTYSGLLSTGWSLESAFSSH